jgi:ubiquinone/menaquinone biosynthesis C-methylase UbiE
VASAAELQGRVDRYFDSAAEYWKAIYEETTVFGVIHQERRARALEWIDQLALPANTAVLEIGCGAGLTSVALADRGLIVTAADTVPAMIRLTNELVEARNLGHRVTTSRVDVHHLPFADESYALVLALGVLPWLYDPDLAVREMARVLRPGGFMLVNIDNVFRLHYLLDPLLNPTLTPIRRLVRKALRRLGLISPSDATLSHLDVPSRFDADVTRAGLHKVKGATIGFGPFTFLHHPIFAERTGIRLHRTLQNLADRRMRVIRSLGAQYLVLAQKGASAADIPRAADGDPGDAERIGPVALPAEDQRRIPHPMRRGASRVPNENATG